MNVDVPRPEHPHPQLARPDWRADIGTIQTLLGHKTAAMARRYAGQALDRQGARLMVQYSPVG